MAAAAGNKFASFLHKHAGKITVVLVYALLEWILIFLLLLNSFFTYLITKFANYFGLKPPCPWCSRVDHVLEPNNSSSSYRDLVCDKHGSEISRLSYCSSHGKLAETHLMCDECLASRPSPSDGKGMTRGIAFISWVSSDHKVDDGEKVVPCSCCNGSKLHPPYFLFKPSWGALDYADKGRLIIEAIEDDGDGSESDDPCKDGEDMIEIKLNGLDDDDDDRDDQRAKVEHQVLSDVEKDVHEDDKSDTMNVAEKHLGGVICSETVAPCFAEDYMLEFINLHHQKCASDRLVPVELVDLSTSANHFSEKKQDNDTESGDSSIEETPLHGIDEGAENTSPGEPENLEPANQVDKDDLNLTAEQTKSETTLLSTLDSDLPQVQGSDPSLQSLREESFPKFKNQAEGVDAPESSKTHNVAILGVTLGVNEEKSTMDEDGERLHAPLSVQTDHNNEAEEEKFPETPTSSHEVVHYMHKKLLFLEKRESGVEESLEGSVLSEMESGDLIQTIERLKTSLKAERKAMSALYAELEEERSASAVATNQTMAMITRLQEEKAAMQMEALQYQRMMEEQSEYDQEALQLLNELMIKREKEKEELEKELEVYRKKVLDYEANERMRTMMISKDANLESRKTSAACSYVEDSDDLSLDLNREAKYEDSSFSGNQESSSDAVGNLEELALDCVNHISALDESLTEFEEERLSILDQLKTLEDKLLTMGDDQFMEDLKSIKNSFNGFDDSNDLSSKEGNGTDNGFHGTTMAAMAKSLLPFLDAEDNGTEEGLIDEKQGESEPIEMQAYEGPEMELDPKKLAIVEEVDRVYERLQALEEDREFLKNCMSSVKKGDKGMDLLQEILQHLRDLKEVELRSNNLSGDLQG